MHRLMQLEPVLVTQLVASVLALAVAFGVPVTEEQRQAILQVVGIIVAIFLGGAVVARSKAYAPATVEREKAAAYEQGVQATRLSSLQYP